MKPKLKLNHISDLHDARYCAALGIDLLGFRMQAGEDHSMTPKSVAEIMEWLSGPEGVGEFDYESPQEIREMMESAKLKWASLPIDYDLNAASEISVLPLVFRGPADPIQAEGLKQIEILAGRFPSALFEITADPSRKEVWDLLKLRGLMGRCMLRFAQPTPIYSLLEREGHAPYAFSLGAFVEESDGAIDYESCDAFVERYEELLPA